MTKNKGDGGKGPRKPRGMGNVIEFRHRSGRPKKGSARDTSSDGDDSVRNVDVADASPTDRALMRMGIEKIPDALRYCKDAHTMAIKRGLFIKAVTNGCPPGLARFAAGVSKHTLIAWRKDADFLADYDDALDVGVSLAEAHLMSQAEGGNFMAAVAIARDGRPGRYGEKLTVEHKQPEDSREKIARINAEVARLRSVLIPRVQALQEAQDAEFTEVAPPALPKPE